MPLQQPSLIPVACSIPAILYLFLSLPLSAVLLAPRNAQTVLLVGSAAIGTRLRAAIDRFGDYLCLNCANLHCASGHTQFTKTKFTGSIPKISKFSRDSGGGLSSFPFATTWRRLRRRGGGGGDGGGKPY